MRQFVTSKKKEGTIYLELDYDAPSLLDTQSRQNLRKELIEAYNEETKKYEQTEEPKYHCIVEIKARIVSSRVVRALFELWKTVTQHNDAQLICVGYPEDYIDSLTSLGFHTLKKFSLEANEEEALHHLK